MKICRIVLYANQYINIANIISFYNLILYLYISFYSPSLCARAYVLACVYECVCRINCKYIHNIYYVCIYLYRHSYRFINQRLIAN